MAAPMLRTLVQNRMNHQSWIGRLTPGLHPSTDEHNSESEDESQDERDDAAPLGQHETKTAAHSRETLLPTCVEITARKVIDEMRLQPQFVADNADVSNPHGSIDE